MCLAQPQVDFLQPSDTVILSQQSAEGPFQFAAPTYGTNYHLTIGADSMGTMRAIAPRPKAGVATPPHEFDS